MPSPPNRVRERREARGLSQTALAERASLSRQSVAAIEAGRAMPAVDVALRLTRALDCRVEDLFDANSSLERLSTTSTSSMVTGRVAVAQVGGRWVSRALSADGARVSADGVVSSARRGKAQVDLVRTVSEARENVFLTGCAAGLGVLSDRLNSRPGPGRFLWFASSSTAALDELREGTAHVAGVHLVDPKTGEANVVDARRAATSGSVVLVTLARWEVGLITRAEDARRLTGVADLGRRGTRLVAREPGAGAQRLFEQELRAAGLSPDLARSAKLVAPGHLEVARAISMGAADAGVATRDAALAFGLRFLPLAEERYDLVVPSASVGDPRLARLFDVLVSAEFRRELTALGYDMEPAGRRVAEVHAA
jgi:molybdate-binding protein/DNA-binding XRE family transcriptional regulator